MIATPALAYLIGAFLHLDWDLDHPDVWAAVDAFVADSPSDAAAIGAEVLALLAAFPDDGELAHHLVDDLLLGYWPGDGPTAMRDFLQVLQQHVQRSLAAGY
jgi:hypothetical protein